MTILRVDKADLISTNTESSKNNKSQIQSELFDSALNTANNSDEMKWDDWKKWIQNHEDIGELKEIYVKLSEEKIDQISGITFLFKYGFPKDYYQQSLYELYDIIESRKDYLDDLKSLIFNDRLKKPPDYLKAGFWNYRLVWQLVKNVKRKESKDNKKGWFFLNFPLDQLQDKFQTKDLLGIKFGKGAKIDYANIILKEKKLDLHSEEIPIAGIDYADPEYRLQVENGLLKGIMLSIKLHHRDEKGNKIGRNKSIIGEVSLNGDIDLEKLRYIYPKSPANKLEGNRKQSSGVGIGRLIIRGLNVNFSHEFGIKRDMKGMLGFKGIYSAFAEVLPNTLQLLSAALFQFQEKFTGSTDASEDFLELISNYNYDNLNMSVGFNSLHLTDLLIMEDITQGEDTYHINRLSLRGGSITLNDKDFKNKVKYWASEAARKIKNKIAILGWIKEASSKFIGEDFRLEWLVEALKLIKNDNNLLDQKLNDVRMNLEDDNEKNIEDDLELKKKNNEVALKEIERLKRISEKQVKKNPQAVVRILLKDGTEIGSKNELEAQIHSDKKTHSNLQNYKDNQERFATQKKRFIKLQEKIKSENEKISNLYKLKNESKKDRKKNKSKKKLTRLAGDIKDLTHLKNKIKDAERYRSLELAVKASDFEIDLDGDSMIERLIHEKIDPEILSSIHFDKVVGKDLEILSNISTQNVEQSTIKFKDLLIPDITSESLNYQNKSGSFKLFSKKESAKISLLGTKISGNLEFNDQKGDPIPRRINLDYFETEIPHLDQLEMEISSRSYSLPKALGKILITNSVTTFDEGSLDIEKGEKWRFEFGQFVLPPSELDLKISDSVRIKRINQLVALGLTLSFQNEGYQFNWNNLTVDSILEVQGNRKSFNLPISDFDLFYYSKGKKEGKLDIRKMTVDNFHLDKFSMKTKNGWDISGKTPFLSIEDFKGEYDLNNKVLLVQKLMIPKIELHGLSINHQKGFKLELPDYRVSQIGEIKIEDYAINTQTFEIGKNAEGQPIFNINSIIIPEIESSITNLLLNKGNIETGIISFDISDSGDFKLSIKTPSLGLEGENIPSGKKEEKKIHFEGLEGFNKLIEFDEIELLFEDPSKGGLLLPKKIILVRPRIRGLKTTLNESEDLAGDSTAQVSFNLLIDGNAKIFQGNFDTLTTIGEENRKELTDTWIFEVDEKATIQVTDFEFIKYIDLSNNSSQTIEEEEKMEQDFQEARINELNKLTLPSDRYPQHFKPDVTLNLESEENDLESDFQISIIPQIDYAELAKKHDSMMLAYSSRGVKSDVIAMMAQTYTFADEGLYLNYLDLGGSKEKYIQPGNLEKEISQLENIKNIVSMFSKFTGTIVINDSSWEDSLTINIESGQIDAVPLLNDIILRLSEHLETIGSFNFNEDTNETIQELSEKLDHWIMYGDLFDFGEVIGPEIGELDNIFDAVEDLLDDLSEEEVENEDATRLAQFLRELDQLELLNILNNENIIKEAEGKSAQGESFIDIRELITFQIIKSANSEGENIKLSNEDKETLFLNYLENVNSRFSGWWYTDILPAFDTEDVGFVWKSIFVQILKEEFETATISLNNFQLGKAEELSNNFLGGVEKAGELSLHRDKEGNIEDFNLNATLTNIDMLHEFGINMKESIIPGFEYQKKIGESILKIDVGSLGLGEYNLEMKDDLIRLRSKDAIKINKFKMAIKSLNQR